MTQVFCLETNRQAYDLMLVGFHGLDASVTEKSLWHARTTSYKWPCDFRIMNWTA